MTIYFILTKPLPMDEKPAWPDMEFVRCNDCPVPFESIEDAKKTMEIWGMEAPQYSIWKVEKVDG